MYQVSQDYALDPQGGKPWYDSLSASPSSASLVPMSPPGIVVTGDKPTPSNDNVSDSSSSKGVVVDDRSEVHNMKSSPTSSRETELFAKTKFKNDSSFTPQTEADFTVLNKKADAKKKQLEQENKTLKEQLLALRVEIKKNELLLQQQKDQANVREAELQRKMEQMKAEHDTVCAEMGTKNAELILKLESLQEMYSNEFHGTVHVKQLQVRLEAERQKVKRLEKEKQLAFGKQDLYKINEELTKELSQAKAEISYLRHMVPKKYLRSNDTTDGDVNDHDD